MYKPYIAGFHCFSPRLIIARYVVQRLFGSKKMTDKYAVIGNPIAHSKSPQIHAVFAKQTNQDMAYEAVLAPLDSFETTVHDLIKQGYRGVNVTVPFKFEAFNLSATRSQQVMLAGAVNTMTFADLGIIGHNTDGDGLIEDITVNLKREIKAKRILLLGILVVANRSLDKAQKVVSKSYDKAWQGVASTFEDLKNQQFDIVINATSTGLTDTALPIPDSIFAKNCLAYDMMYGRETPFMAQAREAGAQVSDGLGMLVEQAAEAFYLWRGVRPETAPIIQMMRS
jgi:shikimate dehydrogenase